MVRSNKTVQAGRALVRSRSSSTWRVIDVPAQFQAAARDLVISFADVTSTMLQRGYAAPNRLLRANLDRLERALTAIFQFSAGGDVTLSWHPSEMRVNSVMVDTDNDANIRGAMRLLEYHYSNRGAVGISLRPSCSVEQFTDFLRQLRDLDAEGLRALSGGLPSTTLAPDLAEISVLLVVENPAPMPSTGPHALPEAPSSRGTEILLSQPDLAWRSLNLPAVSILHQPNTEPLDDASQRLLALSVYTHLNAVAEKLLAKREAFEQGDTTLPMLALQRMIIQVSCALQQAPDYLLACVILGTKYHEPHRQLAHTVIVAVGLGQQLGASPETLAVLGLATCLYRLALPKGDLLSIFQHIRQTYKTSSTGFRAIHVAALAYNAPPTHETHGLEAQCVRVAADFVHYLDGTLTHAKKQAPLPVPSALLYLNTLHPPSVIQPLVEWLGPAPSGSVVQLQDGPIVVVGADTPDGRVMFPLKGSGPVYHRASTQLESWPVARPFTERAAAALFRGSHGPLVAGSIDTHRRLPN